MRCSGLLFAILESLVSHAVVQCANQAFLESSKVDAILPTVTIALDFRRYSS